jgi:magnesium-transporting ATPase (P-type)
MGTFGLNDPIRDDILNTIAQIKHGKCRASSQMEEAAGKAAQVNVKLVTGDHIETAKHVALACGIVS